MNPKPSRFVVITSSAGKTPPNCGERGNLKKRRKLTKRQQTKASKQWQKAFDTYVIKLKAAEVAAKLVEAKAENGSVSAQDIKKHWDQIS
jgi:hypothetical protein